MFRENVNWLILFSKYKFQSFNESQQSTETVKEIKIKKNNNILYIRTRWLFRRTLLTTLSFGSVMTVKLLLRYRHLNSYTIFIKGMITCLDFHTATAAGRSIIQCFQSRTNPCSSISLLVVLSYCMQYPFILYMHINRIYTKTPCGDFFDSFKQRNT